MAMIHITICTPHEDIYSGEADYVLFTTTEGDKGIRPGHENAVLSLREGKICIQNNREQLVFQAKAGMLCFENNNAAIITSFAAPAQVYEQRYQAYKQSLERHYIEEMKSESDLHRAQMTMRQSLVQ